MALLANVQDLISQYSADDDVAKKNQVTISIKPLGDASAGSASSLSPSLASDVPATSTTGSSSSAGVGSSLGAGSAVKLADAGTTPPLTTPTGAGAGGASLVPTSQQLTRNPQLVATPSVEMDDIAASQIAQQRFQAQKNYLSVLQDLGYVDDAGNFIPGLIETEAVRQRQELNRQLGLAETGVDEDATRGGTVFSGRRVQNRQRASEPIVNQLAQLETDVPRLISQRYQEAQDVLRDFELQQNIILADLAARRAAAEMARQTGGGDGSGGGGVAAPTAGFDVSSAPVTDQTYAGSLSAMGGFSAEQLRQILAAPTQATRTPIGYFNGTPYYSNEEYANLVRVSQGEPYPYGNPGVWG